MFEILHKETFAAETYLMDVYAPRIAHSALPGQFLIVKMEENSERIPLTISAGWISLYSKGLSRVFSNTTVQKHQFFSAQLSSTLISIHDHWKNQSLD